MINTIKEWILANCKFAAPARKPFEHNPPVAPGAKPPMQAPTGPAGAGPVQPVGAQPGANPAVAPKSPIVPMGKPGAPRAKMYQNMQEMQPQMPTGVPQNPMWVERLDPKNRQMYDTYKQQNNQKGLQMMEQLHGGKH